MSSAAEIPAGWQDLFPGEGRLEGTCRRRVLANHVLDFHPGDHRLVVIFDDARAPDFRPDPDRPLSGAAVAAREGCSVLAVKAFHIDWFRNAALHDALEELARAGFFRSFQQVLLHGHSMGGYAALAFASLAPGATVLAFAPQVTQDTALVPWDGRYPLAHRQDWSGRFADASVGARTARQVFVAFDPLERPDRWHVERLPPENRTDLSLPFAGHEIPGLLLACGLLKRVLRDAILGRLDAPAFHKQIRARRNQAVYWLRFAERAERKRRLPVAEACHRRALALAPEDPRVRLLEARIAVERGMAAAALPAAEAALAGLPRDAGAMITLARALHLAGDLARAAGMAAQAVERRPFHVMNVATAARILAEAGRGAEAADAVERALTRTPTHPRLLRAKAEIAARPSLPRAPGSAGA